ncbi:pre-mRNA-splicing factor ATP-dependent RNA helicase DEAH1-like isoform X2 [Arabidopsis lyrata subsp. lyrata]|uniref:pre-mRNA-splicing factor ATP-dependent RNA helicase DEAH1-like isoform X2 n=1 Tax=Arabidopsis lyrata subsp. lyrata TaxID=81972 RepID=UPI000A29DDC4|nr:pre-mRNA-splicing factor ATP-dependent RNA helicase DEAH1-like isoform X2 [Arabidopsis lyrata subsp. lyrata]|eukprot:XP_020873248.1 pre-mRNA-splicing factor ATP-dependent RNA helicase DEAH1-like isoform X2 [Arabidopsis lyrata subsp. lyrata]
MAGYNLKSWVSDKLMVVLGYSQPAVVEYLTAMAKNSRSASELVPELLDYGFSSGDALEFAQDICARVPRKAAGVNIYQQEEAEAARIAKKQKTFMLLHADVDEVSVEKKSSESRRPDRGNKNIRKKSVKSEDEDDKDNAQVDVIEDDRRVMGRVSEEEGSESEEDRLQDRREREELEQHIRECDTKRTRRLSEPSISKKEKEEAIRRAKALESDDIASLRKASRQEYLKKREQQKLEELKDEIADEQYLCGSEKLTEIETDQIRYKKELYNLVIKRTHEDDNADEYIMPDAYDQDGGVNQEKRFSVAAHRYKDMEAAQKMNPFAEQEAWEDHQIRKATLKFGAKNKEASDDYQFVFEDHIDFIKASVLAGENYEDEMLPIAGQNLSRKSAFEMLQEERKTLPIYSYRDQLLKAIEDHQVLVIVGDTGSGKTTQIPQYLHEAGYTKHGKVGCTQPRRIAAMSVAARVAHEMGVKLGHEVGYSVRFEDCTSEKTVLKYMTDGMLLRELLGEPDLASYSVIIVDEAHERTLSTDILFGLVKDMARLRPELKLLISSATMDAEKFSNYFDAAPIFIFPGRRFPVDISFVAAPEADYMDAALVTVLQIHVSEPLGDILVFLPGQEEIENVEETLKNKIRGFGTKIRELIICPIYANLPSEMQAKVFEPTPEGARKVVLATNIAETSLTIDGIKYVVDPGFCKIKSYNPRNGMESLLVTPISKASATQRTGRAGRTGPGKCFRLYTAYNFQNDMEDNTVPEIQRTNLASVVLGLKSLGIDDLLNFDFMDPPPAEALVKALELLFALGALNKLGELTKVGRKMAEFPLDPMLSKMIVVSEKYMCSDEIISIAAMLSVGSSIFYRPKDKQVHADNARMNFHTGNVGDHIALLKVYSSWKETNYSTQWCYENYIQVRSMKRARDIRDQLEGLLERVEIKVSTNFNNLDLVRKSIVAGFFPHSAKLQKNGSYRTAKHPLTVHIYPSSGLSQVTELNPNWLVEIAPHYYQLKDVEDGASKKLPKSIGRAPA